MAAKKAKAKKGKSPLKVEEITQKTIDVPVHFGGKETAKLYLNTGPLATFKIACSSVGIDKAILKELIEKGIITSPIAFDISSNGPVEICLLDQPEVTLSGARAAFKVGAYFWEGSQPEPMSLNVGHDFDLIINPQKKDVVFIAEGNVVKITTKVLEALAEHL